MSGVFASIYRSLVAIALIAMTAQVGLASGTDDKKDSADEDFITFYSVDTEAPVPEANHHPVVSFEGKAGLMNDPLGDGSSSQISRISPVVSQPGFGAEHLGVLKQLVPVGGGVALPMIDSNSSFNIGSFTPRYAGFQLGLGDKDNKGFGIALSTGYFAGIPGGAKTIDLSTGGNGGRAYNMGVNFGYAGFRLGGSVLRGGDGADSDYKGYDFGLLYSGSAWSTSLQFAEYSQRRYNFLANNGPADKVQSLELGASYRLGLGITLAGRIQYYDYGSKFLREDASDAQVFFLGTNLDF